MRVLITGGSGFLGGYITAALEAAGHDVFAYDLAPPGIEILHAAPSLTTRLRLGDIGDLPRLLEVCRADKIEAIVHGAARLGLKPSLLDPVGFYQTNIMGLVNACEAARALNMRKVVAVSSNAAYHRGGGDRLVETDPPFSITEANPAGHYGTSKMASEAIGLAYADFHDVDFLALRVTALYGFGMRVPIHLKPMVENAVQGQPTHFETGGPMKRDYTHVLDVCRAFVLAIAAPRWVSGNPRVLNVAAGKVYTSTELAELVRRIIPGADIEIGATLTPVDEANVRMRAPLDITMSKRLLNWLPEWEIEDGIRDYANRYRNFVTAAR